VYCDQCGTRAQPDSVYCRSCGTQLEREATLALACAREFQHARESIIEVPLERPLGHGFFLDWSTPLRVDNGIATFDGAEARLVRRPFTIALLTLATFGLYFIVWFYHARRFAEIRLARPNHAAIYTALLLVPVVNVVAALMTTDLLARALDERGSKRTKFFIATLAFFALVAFAPAPYPWWGIVFLSFIPVALMHADVVSAIIGGRVINKRSLNISAFQTAIAAGGLLLVILAFANLIIRATPLGYVVSVATSIVVLGALRVFSTMRAWGSVEKPIPADRFAGAKT